MYVFVDRKLKLLFYLFEFIQTDGSDSIDVGNFSYLSRYFTPELIETSLRSVYMRA